MTSFSLAGLGGGTLAYAVLVVFVAAVVRGYSGFGASAIMVTGLGLVLPPAEVVPIALLLEIAASLGLLTQVWSAVDWRLMGWLSAGAVLGMPLGMALLVHLPADSMRVLISILVLAASLLIWFGYRFRGQPGGAHIFGTGIVSGLANGIAAIGGLPVVLFLLSAATGAAVSRATLIVYLMLGDIYGTGVAAANDLVTSHVALRAALFAIPLIAGVAIGNRQFLKASPESFRRFTLLLLITLASLGLVRGWIG
ncbi:MAG: TSUP family transporter [Alphaproteobacteria bacterium]